MREIGGRLGPAIASGLYQAAAGVMSDSIRLAPKKYGTLRASAYVAMPTGTARDQSVEAGYGGFAKAYALRQHEEESYKHTEGGAKYLEKAITAYEGRVGQILINAMQNAMDDKPNMAPGGGGLNTNPDAGGYLGPPKGKGRKKKGGGRKRKRQGG
jgi:hypothetical protein